MGEQAGARRRTARRSSTASRPRTIRRSSIRAASSSSSSATTRRYTPELVEQICGVPASEFLEVGEALCANSGRERTSAFVYAVGWTQHTVGVQYIRAAAIIQLLLGNIGRPGGGIMALRGHASIQGSTDIPTLYNILPGYIPMPHAARARRPRRVHRDERVAERLLGPHGRLHGQPAEGVVGRRRDRRERLLLRLPAADHRRPLAPTRRRSTCSTARCKGFFVLGENPAVGSANSRLHRRALAQLDWLVVRDLVEIETASFWYDSPEIETRRAAHRARSAPRSSSCPPPRTPRRTASFTNTQRLLQWHHKAVEPPGRLPLGALVLLPPRPASSARSSRLGRADDRDRPVLDLAWDYPTERRARRAERRGGAARDQRLGADGGALSAYTELKDDGSTACGCWIYCGCFADETNQPARRKPGSEQSWVAPEWGWAWPANRRILYNRASADPDGQPWSERKRYVWWDEERGHVDRRGRARLPAATSAPDYVPPDGAEAEDAIAGDAPVHHAGRRARLAVRARRPRRRAAADPLRAARVAVRATRSTTQRANPARQQSSTGAGTATQPTDGEPGADRYPYVITTYRLTEHHTAGGMSRSSPYLAELQPEMFCEVSPELAAERGARARRLGDDRDRAGGHRGARAGHRAMRPLQVQGRPVHQVGLPYHWGSRGLTTGDSANDLLPDRARPQRAHPGESRRRRATSAPAGDRGARPHERAGARWRTEAVAPRRTATRRRARSGFFTDTSVCIGCKACEVACKEWNERPGGRPALHRRLVRQHGRAGRDTWRHVAFIEQAQAAAGRRRRTHRRRAVPLADELRRLQALHPRRLPRRVPDRRALPHRVRHGRRAGGRLQRLRLLRARVPVRRASTGARSPATARVCQKCTLCYDRTAGGLDARLRARPARPSRSSSDRSTSCASARRTGSTTVVEAGLAGARLYGEDPDDGVGGFGAFFLLLDEPEVYGLPPGPGRHDAPPRRRCGAAPRAAGLRSPLGRPLASLARRVADGVGRRAPRRSSYYGRPIIKAPVWKPVHRLVPLHRRPRGRARRCSALAARLARQRALARRRIAHRGGRRSRSARRS